MTPKNNKSASNRKGIAMMNGFMLHPFDEILNNELEEGNETQESVKY
jgi:hypothetical protein